MNTLTENKSGDFQDKETLLAEISHDLKNPITSSLLAISLLNDSKNSPLNSYQKELIDNMSYSLKYMRDLIANILDRYRLNNKVYILNKISVNFENYINTIIEDSKYIFSDKLQQVKIISGVKDNNIKLDTLEIQRVINNLIANATKYAPQNSVIEIKMYDNIDYVYFSIQNKSKGTTNPKTIFQKFVTDKTDLKPLATGLGLYIVKEIITAHNGDVYAECEPDKYTKIIFKLPRK